VQNADLPVNDEARAETSASAVDSGSSRNKYDPMSAKAFLTSLCTRVCHLVR